MAPALSEVNSPRPLAELLAERPRWPCDQALRFIRALAEQLHVLHRNGQLHLSLDADHVFVAADDAPILGAPRSERRFGGPYSEPDVCPPELAGSEAFDLPGGVSAARAVLVSRGSNVDPRRIDVYQLGVLCCRLLTGQSLQSYLYRPAAKASIVAEVRPILDRSLGYDDVVRFSDCETLTIAIGTCLSDLQLAAAGESHGQDTKSFVADGTQGQAVVSHEVAREVAGDLPFVRLGTCRILERLGQGGMGDVYKAQDESLDRLVAVKVLPAQLARDHDFVRRFRAEASAIAKLVHPHVVQIFSIGEEQGHHYFVMQFVPGESLAQRLHRQGRLSVEASLGIFEQCLTGLAAAHQAGLVHRDIKPGNILLDKANGRALLADFGLAKHSGPSGNATASGLILGTVDYLSPEQARGQVVDARSDLYSMGVLLYEMLSGKLPFSADSPAAAIFQHAYEPPRPLHEVLPEVSPALESIVDRLLNKRPGDRYASAAALLEEVRALRSRSAAAAKGERPAASVVLFAPESDDGPAVLADLPETTALGRLPWVRAKARSIFWRRAPEVVKQLQSTSMQVDLAIEDYARRRKKLARYVAEARQIEAELSAQAESNAQAAVEASARAEKADNEENREAALAEQAVCDENLAALRSQRDLQSQQLGEMELRLAHIDATLVRLESQRDVLQARLKAAEAQRRVAGGWGGRGWGGWGGFLGGGGGFPGRSVGYTWRKVAVRVTAAFAVVALGLVAAWRWTGREDQSAAFSPQTEIGKETTIDPQTEKATAAAKPEKDTFLLASTPTAFAFRNADGSSFFVAQDDGVVRSFDVLAMGMVAPKANYTEHLRRVSALAVSPDGVRLATASADQTVCIWDCETQRVIRRLHGHNAAVVGAAFSGDGQQLYSASADGTLKTWDIQRDTELQSVTIEGIHRGVNSAAFSPDEQTVLLTLQINGYYSLRWFDRASGLERTVFTATRSPSQFAAFLHDGQEIVSLTGGELTVWDPKTGDSKRSMGSGLSAAAVSRDGRHALAGGKDGLHLWSLESGEQIKQFEGSYSGIVSVAISPDGRKGAIGVRDNRVYLVDLPPPPPPDGQLQGFACPSPVHCVAFSPDGFYALSGDESSLRLWNLHQPSDHYFYAVNLQVNSAAFSPDGTQLVYATGQRNSTSNYVGTKWHTENRQTRYYERRDLRHFASGAGRPVSVAFLPGGQRAIGADDDGMIHVWDLSTEQELLSFNAGMAINALALSPDGDQVLIAGKDNAVRAWKLSTQKESGQLLGHTFHVQCVAYGSVDRAVSGAADRTIRVWDLHDNHCLATLQGHERRVTGVALSSDGAFVLSASEDRTVRFWDVAKEQEIRRFSGSGGAVYAVALSPDGQRGLSGGQDNTVRLWELPKRHE